MERKFDIDNFEKFLRDVTDEFKMYPSKRVWHSIYNNLHPGKKWPSVAMSLFLFSTLLFLGYINSSSDFIHRSPILTASDYSQNNTSVNNIKITNKQNIYNHNNKPTSQNAVANSGIQNSPVSNSLKTINSVPESASFENEMKKNRLSSNNKNTSLLIQKKYNQSNRIVSDPIHKTSSDQLLWNENPIQKTSDIQTENTVSQNLLTTKKTNNKFSWQIYASPSVVFGNLNNNLLSNTSADSDPSNDDLNTIVNKKPSIGMELGATIQYSFLKRLKLTTGLQLNYTRYNVEAYRLNHPIGSTLAFNDYYNNDSYLAFRPSSYSNSAGMPAIKLSNETYQLSMPVGVEVKLAGKDDLRWNIGATIQPTLVMGGDAYLISADRNNFIKESSLLANWNLNAGFETFVSYNISGFTWQLGPQFRYQLLSTYSKKYSVIENLSMYGIKLGVSKQLKK